MFAHCLCMTGAGVVSSTHSVTMLEKYRVTQKKTFINKNRITAKLIVRFTQKFGYIRLSLHRRHFQSFMSVVLCTTKTLCLTSAKKMCSNELTGAARLP